MSNHYYSSFSNERNDYHHIRRLVPCIIHGSSSSCFNLVFVQFDPRVLKNEIALHCFSIRRHFVSNHSPQYAAEKGHLTTNIIRTPYSSFPKLSRFTFCRCLSVPLRH